MKTTHRSPLRLAHGLALTSTLLLAACTTPSGPGDNTINEIHKITTEIKTSVEGVKVAQDNLIQKQATLETKTQKTLQLAADHVGNANYANLKNTSPNSYTQLTSFELSAATAVLGPPSTQSQEDVIRDLQLALSESQAARSELAEKQKVALKEAQDARIDRESAVVAAQVATQSVVEKTAALSETTTKLTSAEEQARLAAAKTKDAEEKERRSENAKARLHIAYGFMALGGLIMVGAGVATALHVSGILAAGIFSGGALLGLGWLMTILNEWLQQLWFRITIGVALLGTTVFVVVFIVKTVRTRRQATIDKKIGEGAIGAIEEARNDETKHGGKTFSALEPYLKDWYVDDQGNPDHALKNEIQKRLVKLNLRNPDATAKP